MSEYASYNIKKLEFWNNSSYLDFDFAGYLFTNNDLEIKSNVKYDDEDEDEIPHDEYKYKTRLLQMSSRIFCI